jgi:hypothetical protein
MDATSRYQFLQQLDASYDSRQRGKILQRLLQLAFHSAGYRLVEERISEGIDFDVIHRQVRSRKYSLEARTTDNFVVPVKTEDLRQMAGRQADGYRTGVAALHIAPGARWVFIGREWLKTPSVRVSVGNAPGWDALAREINPHFDAVVSDLASVALNEGLNGLLPMVQQASSE